MGNETTTGDPTAGTATDTPTTGPTSGPSTSDPTVADTEGETTFGAMCSDSSECDAGVCVDMQCVPCSDAPAPDAACAEVDSNTPVCAADGTCVACTPDSCGGGAPACDPEVGCVACTEHSQCPESACHLGGPDQGSCFDVNDVVEVSDSMELEDAVNSVTSGAQRVVRLQAGEYSALMTVEQNEEVALLAGPNVTITGGATNAVYLYGGLIYLDHLHFDTGPLRAISVSNGGEAWLDNVSIENYPNALTVYDGTAHLRRSMFRGMDSGFATVGTSAGTTLIAENTDFGPQGNPVLSIAGEVDLRHVTVAGNTGGIECSPEASGIIRNSIIVNPGASNAGGCGDGIDYVDNASDAFQFGQDVGQYDSGWFVVSDGSRFFLSASGQAVFTDIADWDEGDPRVDIEGDPRPTRARGYPGVDEP